MVRDVLPLARGEQGKYMHNPPLTWAARLMWLPPTDACISLTLLEILKRCMFLGSGLVWPLNTNIQSKTHWRTRTRAHTHTHTHTHTLEYTHTINLDIQFYFHSGADERFIVVVLIEFHRFAASSSTSPSSSPPQPTGHQEDGSRAGLWRDTDVCLLAFTSSTYAHGMWFSFSWRRDFYFRGRMFFSYYILLYIRLISYTHSCIIKMFV